MNDRLPIPHQFTWAQQMAAHVSTGEIPCPIMTELVNAGETHVADTCLCDRRANRKTFLAAGNSFCLRNNRCLVPITTTA
jgi:hypothetical protein